MRALVVTRHGPPEVLAVRDRPDPEPGPGQLAVEVRATGLNFAEVSARQGLYPGAPPPPCILGYELAGEVSAIGPGVEGFAPGDRVVALRDFGAHASRCVVEAELTAEMPAAMSFAEGAAIPVNYLTAHHMLFWIGPLRPGSSVLLHMAAGGVGTAALQLMSTVPGLQIFGSASAGKHAHLRALGCTRPIDYRSEDVAQVVREETGGRGVDLVLDALGGPEWRRSWELLAPTGRMVAFGFANAIRGHRRSLWNVARNALRIPLRSPMQAMNQNRSLQGVHMGKLWSEAAQLRPQLARVLELYEAGVVRPHVCAQVPFAEAAEAHRLIERRENVGKVVLIP